MLETPQGEYLSKSSDRAALALSVLNQQAYALRFQDPQQALSLAQDVKVQAEQLGNEQELCRALATLGFARLAEGKAFAEANQALQAALELQLDLSPAFYMEIVLGLAQSFTGLNETDQALELLEEALELSRHLSCRVSEARALRLQGYAYIPKGAYPEALEVLLKALAISDELGFEAFDTVDRLPGEDKAALFRGIAIVYSNMGEYETCIYYYHVAFDIYQQIDPFLAARTLYNIGIAYDQLEDFIEAMKFYQKSAGYFERHGHLDGVGISLIGVGAMHGALGAYDEAQEALERSMTILKDDTDHIGFYSDAVREMAALCYKRKNYQQALLYSELTLDLLLETKRPKVHLARMHERFAEIYKAVYDFEKALEHYECFHKLLAEHNKEVVTYQIRQLMVQFDTERARKDKEIYELRNIELEHEIRERRAAEAELAKAKELLERKNRDLEEISNRDPLTHLYNRRHLNQVLEDAIARVRRYPQPLCMMICDLDNFKVINDTFSHALGDEVLRTVARLMEQNVRRTDVVARYGGEEFIVIFPETSLLDALQACEKVRAKVEAHPWYQLHPDLRVTLSMGLAKMTEIILPESLINQADDKLYEAKRSGKNRVCY